MKGNRLIPLLRRGDGSTLSLDFTTMATAADLSSRGVTFTRASTTGSGSTTFINSSGLVATAGTDIPRFDYDPTTLTPRGLLIEGSATNVLQYANAFATSPWYTTFFNTPTQVTVSGVTDPAGSSSIWKCVPSGTGLHGFQQNFTFTAVAYTFSIWARSAEHDEFVISDGSAGQGACRFNLTAQTATVIAGVVTPTNPTITPFPGGWFRCSFTMVMAAATRGITYSSFPTGTTPGAFGASFAATGTDGMYFYGAQIELGSGASSVILTGASTATRSRDQLTWTNLASIGFSQTQGTVYAQCEIVEKLRGSFIPYGSFDTAGGGRCWWWLRHNHDSAAGQRILGNAFNSAGSTAITSSNYTHSSGVFKFATTLDTSTASMVYSIAGGAAQVTNASAFTLATATQLSINANNDVLATDLGSMWIRTLKYWPTALPNATLQSLTA